MYCAVLSFMYCIVEYVLYCISSFYVLYFYSEIVLYSVLYFARRFVHHSRGPNRPRLSVPPAWRCVSTLVLHLSLTLVWRLDPCVRVQVGEYPELHHGLT